MAGIRSHEDLVAWKLSDELEDHVYEITARPSARRDRDFCDASNDVETRAPGIERLAGISGLMPRGPLRARRLAFTEKAEPGTS